MKFNEKFIVKLSLLLSIIGIASIAIIVDLVEPEKVAIEEIDESFVDRTVLVNGVIESPRISDGHLFFTLSGRGKIKVVIFESTLRRLSVNPQDFQEGKNIVLEGKVQIYRDQLEILPTKVEI